MEALNMYRRGVVCVSGGMDPLGAHHIAYLAAAKELGSVLCVILNDDRFLMNKKGYYFLPVAQRKAILESVRYVDYVYVHHPTDIEDMTVCEALREIRPSIFAKGGDRSLLENPIPEEAICSELGIEVVYGVGGFEKLSSSSVLVQEGYRRYENRRLYGKPQISGERRRHRVF